MVPDGNTRLRAGDTLVIFARSGSRDQFEERLRAEDTAELFTDDAARFFDLEIPPGSVADGRMVKELAIPGGCTIVSIRRAGRVIVPSGSTDLHSGDILTVFSARGPRSQFAERLRATAAPPEG
jgi:Trk K+ transport system NAD-binding subunit